jgi:hypothetical protein
MKPLGIFVLLVLAGCGCGPDTNSGCGIAGAGFDAKRVREEAQNYQAAYLQRVEINSFPNDCFGRKPGSPPDGSQHFRDLLRLFQSSVSLSDGNTIPLGDTGVRVAFIYSRSQESEYSTIHVWRGDKVLVEERLPQAFRSPLLVGVATISGQRVLVATSHTRATTGMHFIAIYSEGGEVLYRNVHSVSSVWDIIPAPTGIILLGCGETTQITLRKGA